MPLRSLPAPLVRAVIVSPPVELLRRNLSRVLLLGVKCGAVLWALRKLLAAARIRRLQDSPQTDVQQKAQQMPSPEQFPQVRGISWTELLVDERTGGMAGRQEITCVAACTAAFPLMQLLSDSLQRRLYEAQNLQDKPAWLRLMWQYPLGVLVMASFAQVIELLKARLALVWRRAVTLKLHQQLFRGKAYYHLLNQPAGHAVMDADMRVCKDVREACTSAAGTTISIIQVIMSSLVIYSEMTRRTSFWFLIPPCLVAWTMPVVIELVRSPLVGVIWSELQAKTALFKQALTRVELHLERVWMLQGEVFEHRRLQELLQATLETNRSLLSFKARQDCIGMALYGAWFPSFFQGLATFTSAGIILRSVTAPGGPGHQGIRAAQEPRHDVGYHFAQYIENWWTTVRCAIIFTGALGNLNSRDTMRSSFQRVVELAEKLEALQSNVDQERCESLKDQGPEICFEDVTVVTPAGQVLLEKLSFKVVQGQRLLICGHNGAGKSSIIRCLGGLWPVPAGSIARPGGGRMADDADANLHREVYYLPQKPCVMLGSLSDQLTYPKRLSQGLPESELRCWLGCVDLEPLVDRYARWCAVHRGEGSTTWVLPYVREPNWDQFLSLGEQQALSIARLLYHRPRFAVLDECTSGVSTLLERRLYRLAGALGITCISITHRPALQEQHDRMLRLTGHRNEDGRGWELHDLPTSRSLPWVQPLVESDKEAQERVFACLDEERASGGLSTLTTRKAAVKPGETSRNEQKKVTFQKEQTGEEAQRPLVWADAVRAAYPNSFLRFRALLAVGLQGMSWKRAAGRLSVLLACAALHCNLQFQIWRTSMGAVTSGLTGDWPGLVSELVSYLATSALIAGVDTALARQAYELNLDMTSSLSHRLLSLALRAGSASRDPSGPLAQPLQRIAEVNEHLTDLTGQFLDLSFRVSSGVYWLPTLVRGTGPLAFVFWPIYFAIFRTILLFAPNFSDLESQKQELETRFQSLHTRLRTVAEPVAFTCAGQAERSIIESGFEAMHSFSLQNLRSEFFYHYLMSLFAHHSYLPIWMQRAMSGYFASRNAPASVRQLGASPELVVQGFMWERSMMYSETALHRLAQFVPQWRRIDGRTTRLLELLVASSPPPDVGGGELQEERQGPVQVTADAIQVHDLDLVTPSGDRLAKGISFSVPWGSPLLITGHTASGKSLLGAALLGLGAAVPGCGRAASARPSLRLLMPSTERVYLPSGSLGDQVCYPERFQRLVEADESHQGSGKNVEALLQRALEAAGIEYLLARDARGWRAECAWDEVLSGGEQQRMGLARIFHRVPRFALLDECTSMVAHDAEEGLYRALAQDFQVTPITMSQRLYLPDIHRCELRLGAESEAGWEFLVT